MDQINLLGTVLSLSYGSSLSTDDAAQAKLRLSAACKLIEDHASLLSYSQTLAIRSITSFTVVGHNDYLGATGCHGETLSLQYIHSCSDAWLGSLFAHEGQHHLNEGLYKEADLWRDEQSAGTTQLAVGIQIGFSVAEQNYLKWWIEDSNQLQMQQHMQQGLRC